MNYKQPFTISEIKRELIEDAVVATTSYLFGCYKVTMRLSDANGKVIHQYFTTMETDPIYDTFDAVGVNQEPPHYSPIMGEAFNVLRKGLFNVVSAQEYIRKQKEKK